MDPKRIGLYGGTFDPIHLGHLIVARSVLEQLPLDEVVFIPSANPPHKDHARLTDFAHRAEMVRLAIAGEPGFSLDDCENKRAGPSYTLDTVTEFQQRYGNAAEIHWIIGADSLPELVGWHRIRDLVDACQILTVSRPGWDKPDLRPLEKPLGSERLAKLRRGVTETPRIDICSTDIRARVGAGLSIRFLVAESVRDYIESKGLFTWPRLVR